MHTQTHTACKRKQFVIKQMAPSFFLGSQHSSFCTPLKSLVSSSSVPCYQCKSERDKRHQDSQSLLKILLSASECEMTKNRLFFPSMCEGIRMNKYTNCSAQMKWKSPLFKF